MTDVTLTLNGRARHTSVPEGATLAELLREQVGLTGTKIACAEGTCGACTVLVDGRAVALLHPARRAGRGLRGDDDRGPRRRGRAVDAAARVRGGGRVAVRVLHGRAGRLGDRAAGGHAAADSEQVRAAMSGNLCRCGAYPGIERAVLRAAEELAG